MSDKKAFNLIEYGAGGTAAPEEEPVPPRRPVKPAGMGTGGKPTFLGKDRLKYGLKPGEKPAADFVHPPEGRYPEKEWLRQGGMDRELTADEVLDLYQQALKPGGEKFMPTVNRLGGAVGMGTIKRPSAPGLESAAQQIVNVLIEGDDLAEAALIGEAKKKAGKGKLVAKSPGKVTYGKK